MQTLPLLGKLQSGLGKWNGAQNPAAPKAWWDFCYIQTPLWFVQKIDLVHVAFTNQLLLCAWQDKMGGIVQNYQEYGGKTRHFSWALVTLTSTTPMTMPLFQGNVLHQRFWKFSVLYLLKKLPLIRKTAELDPTNNAEDLFLTSFMSNYEHSLLLLRNSDSTRKHQKGMPEVEDTDWFPPVKIHHLFLLGRF